MTRRRTRKLYTLAAIGGLMAVMIGLVAYSPTLYRLFCAATGYGGSVQRAAAAEVAEAPAADERVTVYFDSNVAPGLDWDFRPEQREVTTRVGEPTKIYYYAKNRTDHPVIARAVYNVTPYKIAPYFFKIQCFCFTEERLGPGESARMPVVFYVDEQMMKDKNTDEVRDITLSYTFFEATDPSADAAQAARDLKAGSKALDTKLESGAEVGFDNDARRR